VERFTGKKLLSILLTLCIVIPLLSATGLAAGPEPADPDTPVFAGNGTEEDPYVISSHADLEALSELVNNGNSFAGEHFILAEDIHMTGEFTPICDSFANRPFSGTFDGNFNAIYDLEVNAGPIDAGLFGYISNATIKNLIISGARIYGDIAGGIVGSGTGDFQIASCAVIDSDIFVDTDSGSFAGGIIGYSTLGECSVSYCSVMNSNIYADFAVGGIAGYMSDGISISNCAVTGSTIGILSIAAFPAVLSAYLA